MAITTLNTLFHASVLLCLPLAAVVMGLWGTLVWRRIAHTARPTPHISRAKVAWAAMFWMSPGMMVGIACCVPALYLSHLVKNFDYCVEVVRVNGVERADLANDPICSRYLASELVAQAGPPPARQSRRGFD